MFFVIGPDWHMVGASPLYMAACGIALARACEYGDEFRVASRDDGGEVWSETEPITTHLRVIGCEQPS